MLQECCPGVTRFLSEYYKSPVRMLQERCPSVARIISLEGREEPLILIFEQYENTLMIVGDMGDWLGNNPGEYWATFHRQ